MGVYIKGVSGLPSSCGQCIFVKQRGTSLRTFGECPFLGTVIGPSRECITKRHDDCPLVELPPKHGRLIDESSIKYDSEAVRCMDDGHIWHELCVCKDVIEDLPTVLEPEE